MDSSVDRSQLQTTVVDGVTTRAWVGGSGPPVLLLFGGHFGFPLPLALDCFSGSPPTLSEVAEVHALDKLGQGGTGLPEDPSHWTIDAVVEHVVAYVRAEGLRDLALVGHSNGALIAAAVAQRLTSRIRRLVLVASRVASPDHPAAPSPPYLQGVFATAPWTSGAAAVVDHYLAAQAVHPERWGSSYRQALIARMEDPVWLDRLRRYRDEQVDERRWRPGLQRLRSEVLTSLANGAPGCPVDVLWGADDRSAPLPLGMALFELVARHHDEASLIVLNRAGHHVFKDQPSAFDGHLVRSLSR